MCIMWKMYAKEKLKVAKESLSFKEYLSSDKSYLFRIFIYKITLNLYLKFYIKKNNFLLFKLCEFLSITLIWLLDASNTYAKQTSYYIAHF